MTDAHTPPSRREILKPVELIVLSLVLGLFVGLTVLLVTREPVLAIIFFGIAFIVSLVIIAMFVLTFKPNAAEQQEMDDEGNGGAAAKPYLGPGPKGH